MASEKTKVIEWIFLNRKFDSATGVLVDAVVTMDDINEGIDATGAKLKRDANRANFWKDLTRTGVKGLNRNWPSAVLAQGFTGRDGIDGVAVTANVRSLSEYRDRAIHLYNAPGLGAVIYPFLQQNVLNYRDYMVAMFRKDLAERISWQLLPLGATVPADAVQFMRVDKQSNMAAEVHGFIGRLRGLMDEVESSGSDLARVATVYDIVWRS